MPTTYCRDGMDVFLEWGCNLPLLATDVRAAVARELARQAEERFPRISRHGRDE
jgi:hypothetical protein